MQFSIIVPTLNEERFLGGLLADLANQDYADFEVLHVDGKSEDRTCEIAKSYEGKLTLCSLISARRNLSFQRNLGASQAKGEYLIFMDADVRIPKKTFLPEIAKEIQKTHARIYCPKVQIDKDDMFMKIIWELYNATVEISKKSHAPIPTSGMLIIEKDFFEKIGRYTVTQKQDNNILFAEDQDILRKAKKHGAVGTAISHVYYHMSLRRFEREGWLKTGPKMTLSIVEQLLDKSLLQKHEMGGHLYDNMPQSGR